LQSVKRRYTPGLILIGGLLFISISVFDFVRIDSCAQSAASTISEEAALRAVVESYYAACDKKDMAGVMALWSNKSPNLEAYRQTLQQQFANEDQSYGSPAVSRVKVENDSANLRATIAITSINLKSQQKSERRLILSFELVKEGGAWKVWRCAPAAEDLAEALAKVGSKTERATLLMKERELVTIELGQALLEQGRRLFNKSSYSRAQEINELALDVAERSGDESAMTRALVGIGRAYSMQGNYAQALEQHQRALKISEGIGDKVSIAVALNNIGIVHSSRGDYAQALELYQQSLKIYEEIGRKSGIAAALNNIAGIHRLQGNYPQSLEQLQRGLKISEEIGDKPGMLLALGNIGINYKSQGDYTKALEQYRRSLKISEEIGNKSGMAYALTYIANVYNSRGDYAQALDQYQKSLKISEEIGNKSGIAVALNNIGNVYNSQGDYTQALEQLQRSLKIREEIDDKAGIASTLNIIGYVHNAQDDYTPALKQLQRSLKIREEIGDRAGAAATLNTIGRVYNSQGNYAAALEQYQSSLKITEEIGDKSGIADALASIGEAYRLSGEMRQAIEYYHQALRLSREIGERPGEATALLGIARTERKRGDLPLARQAIEQAIGIIESVRANIIRQELRSSYFASRQEYYESYLDLLMEQHRQNPSAAIDAEAFAVSERARARALLELLTESRANIRYGVEPTLLERERFLQQRLNAGAAAQVDLLNRKHSSAQAEAAAREIASIIAEYEELKAQLRASSPKYAALTQPQPLNLAEIQQQVLDPDTLLLEYSLGDNASHLFVVSQTSITSHQLPKRAEIEAAARRVRELLTAQQHQPGDNLAKYQSRIKEAGERYRTQAAALSRILLGPVASQLGRKRLAIVADGALQYIPFAALPEPSPSNDAGRNSGAEPLPLFVEHEIVSLPSASTLATLRRETAGRKPAEKSLAVLADPVFSDDDTRVRRNTGEAGEKTGSANSDEMDISFQQMSRSGREMGVIGAEGGFGRLLSTRREAAAISALVPERDRMLALDFKASRATALGHELGEYRIVHFATHGMLNNIHPELSGIVLSLVDKEGKRQDGFLWLQDIYNLKLPAELVVLSACQTGLGKDIKGEGLIGMTRGFMYAGAPRIVASLWKVDDWATSELMKRFYQGLLGPERLRPAAALRQAQLSIRNQKQWRAPYYWAAFVLQGEWK
jgi:CHAT domain-containing protein/uncharacterized protein HemY